VPSALGCDRIDRRYWTAASLKLAKALSPFERVVMLRVVGRIDGEAAGTITVGEIAFDDHGKERDESVEG
jgi:hypothetical protein